MVAWLPMTPATNAVPDKVESSYGWCGVCHSFTVFPHECPEEERPAPEDPG
jgi:hypothetical protein